MVTFSSNRWWWWSKTWFEKKIAFKIKVRFMFIFSLKVKRFWRTKKNKEDFFLLKVGMEKRDIFRESPTLDFLAFWEERKKKGMKFFLLLFILVGKVNWTVFFFFGRLKWPWKILSICWQKIVPINQYPNFNKYSSNSKVKAVFIAQNVHKERWRLIRKKP